MTALTQFEPTAKKRPPVIPQRRKDDDVPLEPLPPDPPPAP